MGVLLVSLLICFSSAEEESFERAENLELEEISNLDDFNEETLCNYVRVR